MALTANQKNGISRFIMRRWSRLREPCGFIKSQLRSAIDEADGWVDAAPDQASATNQASYNKALNPQFRNAATVEQKTLLLMAVIGVRAGLTPEDLRL